jgi:protein-disulfide isomerase
MMTAASAQLTPPVTSRDHICGPAFAEVTLVEYGDYTCPRCNEAHSVVKRLLSSLGDRLRYVFRHFPSLTSNPNRDRAAEAAEASGAQNKFWEMHDALYNHQLALSDKHLRVYATQVGLDMERFNREMMQHTHVPHVQEDVQSAGHSGVSSVPTFFINDSQHLGSCDFETLISEIEKAALKQPS